MVFDLFFYCVTVKTIYSQVIVSVVPFPTRQKQKGRLIAGYCDLRSAIVCDPRSSAIVCDHMETSLYFSETSMAEEQESY